MRQLKKQLINIGIKKICLHYLKRKLPHFDELFVNYLCSWFDENYRLEILGKILFYIFPSILIFRSSEYLIENYIGQILMSGILAGLGAILGATSYKIVENKSTMAKVLAFIISTVLCILYLYLIAKNLKVK